MVAMIINAQWGRKEARRLGAYPVAKVIPSVARDLLRRAAEPEE
jgi:hypothetical protein